MDEASREEEYQDTIQIRTTEGGDELTTDVVIAPLKFNPVIYKLLCISYDVLSRDTSTSSEESDNAYIWLKQITLRGSVLIEEYKENALVVAQTQVNSDAGVIAPRPLGKTTSMFNTELKNFINKICEMINSIPNDNQQIDGDVIGKTNIMYLLRNYYKTSDTQSDVSETSSDICYSQLTDLWNKRYPIVEGQIAQSAAPSSMSIASSITVPPDQSGPPMEIDQNGGTQEQTDEMLEEDDDALMEYKFEGVDEDSEDNNKKIHLNIGSGGSSRYSRRHSKKYVHKTSIRARSSSKKSAKRGSRKMHVVKTKKHTRRNYH
jgi:hypothetical protein